MFTQNNIKNKESIEGIILKGTILCLFLLLALLAVAILGIFNYQNVLIIIIFFSVVFLAWVLLNLRRGIEKPKRFEIIALILIIIFIVFTWYYQHGLPRGRDDMSYIFASVKLVEEGELKFTDTLSRPYHGLRYLGNDVFTSQFLPGYISLLGVGYLYGGIIGINFINPVIVGLAFFIIFYLGKRMAGYKAGFMAVLFLATYYTSFWFPRRTNSENLFLLLIFLSVYLFLVGYQKKRLSYLFLGLFASQLAVFTRGEGILYLIIYLIVLFILLLIKREYFKNQWSSLGFLIPIGLSVYFFASYLALFGGDYIFGEITKAYSAIPPLVIFGGLIGLSLVYLGLRWKWPWIKLHWQKLLLSLLIFGFVGIFMMYLIFSRAESFSWESFKYFYYFEILTLYFLFVPYLFILYGLRNKIFKRSDLLVVLLLLPTFGLLLENRIAPDLPWFLRRYYPVFIPLLWLFSGVVMARSQVSKKSMVKIVLAILAVNLFFAAPILFFRENKGIDSQLTEFKDLFTEKDLILMEPGWSWQQWGYALHYLYQVNIIPNTDVYPNEDFKEEIKGLVEKYPNWVHNLDELEKLYNYQNQRRFEELQKIVGQYQNVYILSERDDSPYPHYNPSNLEFIKQINWQYEEIDKKEDLTSLVTNDLAILNYEKISRRLKEVPARHKNLFKEKLYLYKVIDKDRLINRYPPLNDFQRIISFRDSLTELLN